jgi:hypothetical protein
VQGVLTLGGRSTVCMSSSVLSVSPDSTLPLPLSDEDKGEGFME